MTRQDPKEFKRLRKKAEALLEPDGETIESLSPQAIKSLIHDLKVHQIELELQNEELQHTQGELEKARNRYARLFNHAPVGYLITDSAGIILQANQTFAEMLGLNGPELNQKPFSQFILPRDRETFLGRFRAFFKSPGGKQMDLRMGTSEEESFYARLQGRVEPFLEQDGAKQAGHERLLLMVSDISEQKAAQRALENKHTELEEILNALPDAVVYADPDRRIRKVNPAFTRIYGYTAEEVMGEKTAILYADPDEFVKQGQERYNIQAREMHTPYEIRYQRKDGSCFISETVGTPVRNAADEVVGLMGVVRDITDRKQAEAEKERLESQLRQAQKMEAVGRLAAGFAHDFNNMLSPILGYSELLLDELHETDPRYDQAEEIRRAAIRSRDLIRQLLAFSRKQVLSLELLDLNPVIEDFQKMLSRAIREDIELRLFLDPGAGKIKADLSQIEQILMNLAVNAQDAMPDGGVLTIETAPAELDAEYAAQKPGVTPGEYVRLSVSDTGRGMEPAVAERIFEPFYTTKEKSKGTGLGLATVYGIVKQHGGNIWVYSEAGQGTTFKLYFPRISASEPESETKPPPEPAPKGAETVMVVEDSEMVRKLACGILKKYGYHPISAANGRECLQKIREYEGTVSLLLTDLVMPDMNGKELASLLTRSYPRMKVLFMSGYTDNVIARHGVLDPGVHFISKPFTVRSLAEKVQAVLEAE